MALSYPNPSRDYDASRHCGFWGYGDAREVAFFRSRVMGPPSKRPPFWDAFDRYRERKITLARDIYTPGIRKTYAIS